MDVEAIKLPQLVPCLVGCHVSDLFRSGFDDFKDAFNHIIDL
jgi:hypothetical protein